MLPQNNFILTGCYKGVVTMVDLGDVTAGVEATMMMAKDHDGDGKADSASDLRRREGTKLELLSSMKGQDGAGAARAKSCGRRSDWALGDQLRPPTAGFRLLLPNPTAAKATTCFPSPSPISLVMACLSSTASCFAGRFKRRHLSPTLSSISSFPGARSVTVAAISPKLEHLRCELDAVSVATKECSEEEPISEQDVGTPPSKEEKRISGIHLPRQKYISVNKVDLLDAILSMFRTKKEIEEFKRLAMCLDSILHAEHKAMLEEMRACYSGASSQDKHAYEGSCSSIKAEDVSRKKNAPSEFSGHKEANGSRNDEVDKWLYLSDSLDLWKLFGQSAVVSFPESRLVFLLLESSSVTLFCLTSTIYNVIEIRMLSDSGNFEEPDFTFNIFLRQSQERIKILDAHSCLGGSSAPNTLQFVMKCRATIAKKFQRSFMKLLRDAQFEELSIEDLLLADALNTDYLLRLPIFVDWKKTFDSNAIIFKRGYTTERQQGLLIVEKLDYLQSKLLDSIFSSLSKPMKKIGRWINEVSVLDASGCVKPLKKERGKLEGKGGFAMCDLLAYDVLIPKYFVTSMEALLTSETPCNLYRSFADLQNTSQYGVVIDSHLEYFILIDHLTSPHGNFTSSRKLCQPSMNTSVAFNMMFQLFGVVPCVGWKNEEVLPLLVYSHASIALCNLKLPVHIFYSLQQALKDSHEAQSVQIWMEKVKSWLRENYALESTLSFGESTSRDQAKIDQIEDSGLPVWLAAQKAVSLYEGLLSPIGPRGRLIRRLLAWIGVISSPPEVSIEFENEVYPDIYLRPNFLPRITLSNLWEPATWESCGYNSWKVLKTAAYILFSKSTLQEPAFQELVLLYADKGSRNENEDLAEINPVQLKIYEKIPIPDLSVRLDVASLVGLLAYFINYKFENIASSPYASSSIEMLDIIYHFPFWTFVRFREFQSAVFLDVIAITALIIYITRVVLGYKQTTDRYQVSSLPILDNAVISSRRTECIYLSQLLVNRTLYEKTLASGFGSVHFLLDASEQQQFKEAILVYSILLHPETYQVSCRKKIRESCEKFIYDRFREKIEMPIDKAVETLTRLGLLSEILVEGKIILTVLPSSDAFETLRDRWIGLLA
ncbi:hypothetical protein ZIOFF_061818 [Zingiber officinale]|uniref:Uncharacterized protein n=1 Tax=Zingiber officinale TaxID=94328 RepID=A0A8J5KA51_ZINOF|nr:hypothetical protein ZIOFF_061818 [Zingiber officinale]